MALREERQTLAGMDKAGLAEESCPDGSLCQYAQKITACFGGRGKNPYRLCFAGRLRIQLSKRPRYVAGGKQALEEKILQWT